MAILVFFEQFFGKFCLDFWPLNLSVSPNNAFCSYIFDCACLSARLIVMEKVRNYGKLVFIKNMFKGAGEGDASPHPSLNPPMPAPITMSFTTTPTNRFSFSMMWGKFCQNCFEITALHLHSLDTSL